MLKAKAIEVHALWLHNMPTDVMIFVL